MMENFNHTLNSFWQFIIKIRYSSILPGYSGKILYEATNSFTQVVCYSCIIMMFIGVPNFKIYAQNSMQITVTEARKIIAEGNIKWGKARVDFDKKTFEEMLSPDFYVIIGERKISRQEFIDGISFQPPGGKLLRFDATVLTVQQTPEGWVAIIHEKIERETPAGKIYSLWITKDGWKKEGDKWLITFSEALGNESWRDGSKPPFRDW